MHMLTDHKDLTSRTTSWRDYEPDFSENTKNLEILSHSTSRCVSHKEKFLVGYCGIPQGNGFFPLWDFSKIENLSLNILAGIGFCHITARLVSRRWISHKATFVLVGKCSCESFESAARRCSDEAAVPYTGGSRQ